MERARLIKISFLVITLTFLLVGLIFFRKEKPAAVGPAAPAATAPATIPTVSAHARAREQRAAQMALEAIVTEYKSYAYGDFSDLSAQMALLSTEMQQQEQLRLEKLRSGDNPLQNITVQTTVASSQVIAFDYEKQEIVLEMVLTKNYYHGVVQAEASATDQPAASRIIDTAGKTYAGNFEDLLFRTESERVRASAIRQADGWKMQELQTII